jgi:hypothetical protein
MSAQSDARRQRRALKKAGIGNMHRLVIERAAIEKLERESEHDGLDLVMHTVESALRALIAEGVDVMRHTVVTIGEHPDFPDAVTVEAKVAG